jgi:glycosyltransferase involved in cell wall biosynthesis
MLEDTGIVVIARNEGDRLKAFEVVSLEKPYNQPRGRNAGLRRLRELDPNIKYVFFMDGDCLLEPGFLEKAHAELEKDPGLGSVCGRRLELEGLGGYRETMVSGEDFELCHRLRRAGWRVLRMPLDMTRHDVGLKSFKKWWWRHARGGYSFAHATALNIDSPDWHKVKIMGSIVLWSVALPFGAIVLAPVTLGTSLGALLAANGVLFKRIRDHRVKDMNDSEKDANIYAAYILVGKFAEMHGLLWFLWRQLRGRSFSYFDYKDLNKKGAGAQ